MAIDPDTFRDALSRWASTVTVVAVRDGADVHGLTVTSFMPVSTDPPRVLVSLSPNARVLPFVQPDTRFVVSLLDADQRRVASDLADAFPVGPDPFPADGPPAVRGAMLALVCSAARVVEVEGGGHLVVGDVEDVLEPGGERPLLYCRRGYRTLAD